MEGLYLDQNKHIYYFEGEKKPSVSDILGVVDGIALKNIPLEALERAGARGTRVHEETENLEYGLVDLLDDEWQEENFDISNYVYAYANFMKAHPSFPLASEEALFSHKYDFAGTIDLVKVIDGKLAIIDKKTSSTISALRSKLQLNAYRLLWNEHHRKQPIEALYILHLKDNGEHRLLEIPIDEKMFLKYLKIYNEIKGDKKI